MSEPTTNQHRAARRGVAAAAALLLILACAGLLREITRPPAAAMVVPGAASGAFEQRIDINTASAPLLQTLPGIGPRLAQRIVESRSSEGPFPSIEDLQRVPGIGPRTVARLEGIAFTSNRTSSPASPSPRDRLPGDERSGP